MLGKKVRSPNVLSVATSLQKLLWTIALQHQSFREFSQSILICETQDLITIL